MAEIQQLPVELLVKIFEEFVPVETVMHRCRLVCKHWHDVALQTIRNGQRLIRVRSLAFWRKPASLPWHEFLSPLELLQVPYVLPALRDPQSSFNTDVRKITDSAEHYWQRQFFSPCKYLRSFPLELWPHLPGLKTLVRLLPGLRVLNLSSVENLGDLEALSSLKQLEVLWLCSTDIVSVQPLQNCITLKELYLSGSHLIRDVGTLANLSSLQLLDISYCLQIQSADLAKLARLPMLTSLYARDLDPNVLHCLASFGSLQFLLLNQVDFSSYERDQKPFPLPSHLSELSLTSVILGDLSLIQFETCAVTLKVLWLGLTAINSLDGLRWCRNLCELHCGGTNLQNLQGMDQLPKLRLLELSDCELGSSQLSVLAPLNIAVLIMSGASLENMSWVDGMLSLCSLRLDHCEFDQDLDMSFISQLPLLKELSLAEIEFDSIAGLANCPSLEWLCLSNAQADDLDTLGMITSLKYLDLSFAQVTSLNLQTIAHQLTCLRELNLRDSSVPTVAPLANALALEILDIACTSVSDLTPLASTPRLRKLTIDTRRVSDVGVLAQSASLKSLILEGGQLVEGLDQLSKIQIEHVFVRVFRFASTSRLPAEQVDFQTYLLSGVDSWVYDHDHEQFDSHLAM